MHVDPSRAKQLSEACAAVSKRITAAAKDERNVPSLHLHPVPTVRSLLGS